MQGGPRVDGEAPARGQTSIDFLIGVAVFMLAVAFVLGTIPGMIDPFEEGQEETLVTDRVASQLADSMLGEPGRPGRLNETCTYAFFDAIATNGSDCPVSFDRNDDIPDRLGIASHYQVNVSLQRNVTGGPELEVVCTDGDAVLPCNGAPTRLADGPLAPTGTQSVTSARRTVFLDGKDLTMVVRLW